MTRQLCDGCRDRLGGSRAEQFDGGLLPNHTVRASTTQGFHSASARRAQEGKTRVPRAATNTRARSPRLQFRPAALAARRCSLRAPADQSASAAAPGFRSSWCFLRGGIARQLSGISARRSLRQSILVRNPIFSAGSLEAHDLIMIFKSAVRPRPERCSCTLLTTDS